MSRILVTGSADGLGRLTAEALLADGHDVVAHVRTSRRAADLGALTARGAGVVVGDLADRDQVRAIAEQLRGTEPLDAIVHNAGVWSGRDVMPVNIVAPYLLTALLPLPDRLVFLSSGAHHGGRPVLAGVDWTGRRAGSYGDSKLFVSTLATAIARLHPTVRSDSVDPGWVPTRMGGPSAPDDLEQGHRTQEWLATGPDLDGSPSGRYWYHRQPRAPHDAVLDVGFQDRLLQALAEETGERLGDRER